MRNEAATWIFLWRNADFFCYVCIFSVVFGQVFLHGNMELSQSLLSWLFFVGVLRGQVYARDLCVKSLPPLSP